MNGTDFIVYAAALPSGMLMYGGAALFVIILVIGIVGMFSSSDAGAKRMRQNAPGKTAVPSTRTALPYTQGDAGLMRMLKPVSRFLEPRSRTDRLALAKTLLRAGFYNPGSVNKFLMARIVCSIFCPVPTLLIGRFALGFTSGQWTVLWLGLGAVVGYYMPRMVVHHFMQKRQEAITGAFPEALDMLLICVASGSSLTSAFQRVGQEFREFSKPLSEEFRYLTLELQAGISRAEAFRNLADRVNLPEVGTLVSLLIQSETLGASLSKTLRIHAEEMRKDRMNKAEELANKLPVKISAVTALFILPCVFVVVLTPAVIQVMQSLKDIF